MDIDEENEFRKQNFKVPKNIYLNSFSQIINNGKLTNSFQILRGVRQGDPLSTLLFILAVEPLLERIRNESIGIKTKKLNKKVNAHADDTTLFSKDLKDQENTLKIIEQFCKISSGELNLGRCKAITKIQKDKVNKIIRLRNDEI